MVIQDYKNHSLYYNIQYIIAHKDYDWSLEVKLRNQHLTNYTYLTERNQPK